MQEWRKMRQEREKSPKSCAHKSYCHGRLQLSSTGDPVSFHVNQKCSCQGWKGRWEHLSADSCLLVAEVIPGKVKSLASGQLCMELEKVHRQKSRDTQNWMLSLCTGTSHSNHKQLSCQSRGRRAGCQLHLPRRSFVFLNHHSQAKGPQNLVSSRGPISISRLTWD